MKKFTALLITCIFIFLFISCNNTSNKGDSASLVFGEEITTTKFTFDSKNQSFSTSNDCFTIYYYPEGVLVGGYYTAIKNISIVIEYYRVDNSLIKTRTDNFKIITPMQPGRITYEEIFQKNVISEIAYINVVEIIYTPLHTFKKGTNGEYPKYDSKTGNYLGVYSSDDTLLPNYSLGEHGFLYDDKGNKIN